MNKKRWKVGGKKEKSVRYKYNPIELSDAPCTDRLSSIHSMEIYSRKSLSVPKLLRKIRLSERKMENRRKEEKIGMI